MTVSVEAVAIGIMAALIAALASIVVALIARSSSRQATAVSWAEQLLARLTDVEAEQKTMKTKQEKSERVIAAAMLLIERLLEWGRTGGKGPRPQISPVLHEYLDETIWSERHTQ